MEDITPEQLADLKAKADEAEKYKAESAEKQSAFDKAQTEWQNKEKEYQEQINPNWQKTRQRIDVLEKIAKEKGVEFDADGNPIVKGQPVDLSEVERRASETTKRELLNARRDELLGEYDATSREVVKKYFEKLTTGEEVTMGNVKSFVLAAERAAFEDNSSRKVHISGQGPRMPETSKLDDASAKELGSKMNLPFAMAPDKK